MNIKIPGLILILLNLILPLASEGSVPLGISFPPVANVKQLEFSEKFLADLGVRYIRISLDWDLREPEEGEYNWEPFDRRMDFCADLGITPFITLNSNAPGWLRKTLPESKLNNRSAALDEPGNEKLSGFVTVFIQRYRQRNPGLVSFLQFGNEWQSEWWYAGSGLEYRRSLEAVYGAAKKVDPDITVVLGGFAWGTAASLAAYDGRIESFWGDDGKIVTGDSLRCMVSLQEADQPGNTALDRIKIVLAGSAYDWVDVHLYDQPELWIAGIDAVVSRIRQGFNGKIVCTEFGGPHPYQEKGLSDAEHAERLTDYLKTINSLDLAYALHFRLVRTGQPLHADSGLVRKNLIGYSSLPAYDIFKQACGGIEVLDR